MMGFEAVEGLGITVVPVAKLKTPCAFVEDADVLLVRDDLNSIEQDRVVDWITEAVLEKRAEDGAATADYARLVRDAEHMLEALNRLRKRPPVFHHTAEGLISTWPDITLPLGARTGPGNPQRSLCGMYPRDVWLRGDNLIVIDVLGDVRICRRCAASHAAATTREAGR